ncbi:MAG: 2-C-methyl-D-erythritol 4-phosphate cytidylyltransferase [Solirubrobacteraceae bacterium]
MAAVALLLAAGRGERLGAAAPKAFVELAGRPLLQWSLDVLAASRAIERIVLALPEGVSAPPDTVRLPSRAVCVEGGAVRSASVRRALAIADSGDPVLVHDAARPLVTVELLERTLRAALEPSVDAAIAAAPIVDTVKLAEGHPPIVSKTLDRTGLWAVQTPQVFRRAALERALNVSEELLAHATDDAWLVERAGGRVAIVESGSENLKVTTRTDLALAGLLLADFQS